MWVGKLNIFGASYMPWCTKTQKDKNQYQRSNLLYQYTNRYHQYNISITATHIIAKNLVPIHRCIGVVVSMKSWAK